MAGKKKRKKTGKFGVFVGLVFALFVLAGAKINEFMLEEKLAKAMVRQKNAEIAIEAEQRRAEELEEMKVDIKTRRFIEETAREKFGLTYENEIVFEAENE